MKKSIRKAAAIALTAAMAVSMTACGGGSDAPAETKAQDEAANPAPEKGRRKTAGKPPPRTAKSSS